MLIALESTRDREVSLGEHRPELTILVVLFDAVPIRAVGTESGKWARGRRHGIGEELVDVGDFELDAAELLLNLWLPALGLGLRHLERDEARLGLLLRRLNPLLERPEMEVNLVPQASFHLLQLLEHELQARIDRLVLLVAARVVEGKRLH